MTDFGTAAVFVGTGRPFELRGYPLVEPEPGGILVRVGMANVCGSDLHMWRGELDLERLNLPMPLVLGHEAVGVVERLGAGVAFDSAGTPLAPGDRIAWRYFQPCGRCRSCLRGRTRACQQNHRFISRGRSAEESPHFFGAYATHHQLPAGQVAFRVPDGLTDQQAAGANCGLAEVIQGFDAVDLRPGETVVIQGAGGLGLNACAVASSAGAERVVVLDAVRERLDLATAFGADVAIDLSELPTVKDRVRAVKDATGGWGGDVVAEFVGHASAVADGIQMVSAGGRYLEVGCVHTGTSFDFDPSYLTLLNRSIVSVVYYEPWALEAALRFLDRTRDQLPWERLHAARYPLADIDRAFSDADRRAVPRAALVMDGSPADPS
jgi:D-arabinose 1-dehydrogenase-like Zn-dependent alcohol dehydrogenase